MILSWQWQDGTFLPCDSIPLADRGFRYGMSLFETFRVLAGHPQFLTEHLTRLRQACLQLDFPLPEISPNAIRETLRPLSGLARLYVTADEGDASAPVTHSRIILFIEERAPISEEKRAQGYALAIDPEPHRPLFGGLKTANYWSNLAAFSRARRQAKDETVLLNEAGNVLSASLANLFIVRNGRIETPPTSSGARNGVVRAWVTSRRPIREHTLTAADLAEAEEIFLTSSWLGIMPVSSLEGRILPPQPIALKLHTEYEAG